MFLKRRDWIAWILILTAALCWVTGQRMLNGWPDSYLETTAPAATFPGNTSSPVQGTIHPTFSPEDMHMGVNDAPIEQTATHIGGFVLSFVGAAFGIAGVFVLFQKSPLLGPDLIFLMPVWFILMAHDLTVTNTVRVVLVFGLLFCIRELWGWVIAKLDLKWCLCFRLAQRCKTPQLSLVSCGCWIVGIFLCLMRLFASYYYFNVLHIVFAVAAVVLVLGCLWKYGTDLHHFQTQLARFQNGQPIVPSDGSFRDAEQKLLDVQAAHEEAICTAVTSERFKVDLISNVSHDLRTPLTAILGYSELLQKEVLTAEGREQLGRLNQKAGYMSDLVDSLFELTKVSSGVIEAKKDEIDLICLLEQTIGLFDDQLTEAGLVVRRSYCAESMTVITDGARLHQVFANLLGNAIKYAMKGTRIYLEVLDTENCIRVRMMNTSSYEMDFKPEEILQRFARGDKSRSTKGSGLGLAIAQTYTESVGGAFRVGVDGDQFSAIVELPKTERIL